MNYFIAEIDGASIETLEQYMEAVKRAFMFPDNIFENTSNIDSYLNWMRDLSWLDTNSGYVLFISNFSKMMTKEQEKKSCYLNYSKKLLLLFGKKKLNMS